MCRFIFVIIVAACASPPPQPADRVVIVEQVDRIDRGGRTLSTYRELPETDPRVAPARRATETPAMRRVLVLLHATRRMRAADPPPAGIDLVSWRRALRAPFYLSVAGQLEEHGGAGFVLRTEHGDEDHLATPFVELVGGPEQLASPFYARDLVHEATHALLALAAAQWFMPCEIHKDACGRVPSAFHDVQRPTQPLQALNEGYSEHMEALASLERPAVESLDWALSSDGSVAAARAFVSPRGRRLDHVIWNRAIFEPAKIPETVIARDGIEAAHRAYQDSQPNDDHRLRTCREMLSTEGVVASMLVRLALDHTLVTAVLPASVEAMLPSGRERAAWLSALGPSAPIELRMIYLLAHMPATTLANTSERGFQDVVQRWQTVFPADAPVVARVVVMTSLGATASAVIAAKIRDLLATPEIVPANDPRTGELRSAKRELLALAESAAAPDRLFAACGPPLWIAVPGRTLCGDFGGPCLPLELDLNAASELDLRLLPGVDAAKALRAIEARDRRGYFATREDALVALDLSAADAASLSARPTPALPVD